MLQIGVDAETRSHASMLFDTSGSFKDNAHTSDALEARQTAVRLLVHRLKQLAMTVGMAFASP
jgi:hypothetical protein